MPTSEPPPPTDENALFSRFDALLAEQDVARAADVLAELRASCGDDDSDVTYCAAQLAWVKEDDDTAAELLARVIELDETHADAHYDLACLAEEHGDREAMVHHFLRVRALDATTDKAIGIGSDTDFDAIEQRARTLLDELPEPFAGRLAHVPVIIERRPSRHLVEDGFDPRAFGLFEGPTDGEHGIAAPTRIVLYACNLIADFPERAALHEQVEITVLHEIGHFFGLSEQDMERLGLD